HAPPTAAAATSGAADLTRGEAARCPGSPLATAVPSHVATGATTLPLPSQAASERPNPACVAANERGRPPERKPAPGAISPIPALAAGRLPARYAIAVPEATHAP